jgi:hypothetical protein
VPTAGFDYRVQRDILHLHFRPPEGRFPGFENMKSLTHNTNAGA